MHVPDIAMTLDTRHLFKMPRILRNRYRFDHRLMAITTLLLGHLSVPLGYSYRLMKTAQREIIGMPEPIRSLGVIFADEILGRVAIVTGRRGVMTGLLPAVILLVHDVTIGARRRVVAHVRIPLSVPKRIHANPHGKAQTYA